MTEQKPARGIRRGITWCLEHSANRAIDTLQAQVRALTAERDEAQGHVRNHHREVCESCMVDVARAETAEKQSDVWMRVATEFQERMERAEAALAELKED